MASNVDETITFILKIVPPSRPTDMAANHHILLHDVVHRRRGMPQHAKPEGWTCLATQHSVRPRAESLPQATRTPQTMADNPATKLAFLSLPGELPPKRSEGVQDVRHSIPQLVADAVFGERPFKMTDILPSALVRSRLGLSAGLEAVYATSWRGSGALDEHTYSGWTSLEWHQSLGQNQECCLHSAGQRCGMCLENTVVSRAPVQCGTRAR